MSTAAPTPSGVTLLLGGARSGKSSLAVEIGARHSGPVLMIATAEAFDDDMHRRITQHRAERPDWPTAEVPVELAAALSGADPRALVIVDCLTVWLGNLFHHLDVGLDPAGAPAGATAGSVTRAGYFEAVTAALAARTAPTVVISNEVGLGLHPDSDLGRVYRDELGRLNQRIAAVADRTLLLVAGRALVLGDPWASLT